MPIGLSRGPRFGSGVDNGCFRRPKGLIGTKAASAIALAMAPGWGDRRDRANLWRKATSPGTGANATKKQRSYRQRGGISCAANGKTRYGSTPSPLAQTAGKIGMRSFVQTIIVALGVARCASA